MASQSPRRALFTLAILQADGAGTSAFGYMRCFKYYRDQIEYLVLELCANGRVFKFDPKTGQVVVAYVGALGGVSHE